MVKMHNYGSAAGKFPQVGGMENTVSKQRTGIGRYEEGKREIGRSSACAANDDQAPLFYSYPAIRLVTSTEKIQI